MLKHDVIESRELKRVRHDADLVIVGGGLAGTCGAIAAARAGLRVVLVQDRPVLGGNSSSEVRLWVLGATSHMGNNNRWAREGGVVDEVLVENMYRNPEGNALIFDTILLEKCYEEENLTLLLNTAAFEVTKRDADTIESVRAFCSQNSVMYELYAPLFCDASGDGVLGFLAGAAFRMGAESADEFNEQFAPSDEYGELLGHSMYFYTKDVGRPVRYVPPSFALDDITRIPRYRSFNTKEHGCQLWWIEYGGRLDTVHETEEIKWELWKVVYGVWNHIKNSGEFPEAENLTLEWVGHVPGKRESRRFEGDMMISQRDLIEQRQHDDAVSFGGWAIDLHPADGVFSEKPGCTQWHSKGVYQIPYRCMYSRNINNLFLAGRIISATHVAFGSTRVMATCAHGAQAVAAAAAVCKQDGCLPREVNESSRMARVQRELVRRGQFIPNLEVRDPEDLAQSASVTASSTLKIKEFDHANDRVTLEHSRAVLIPMPQGRVPRIEFAAEVTRPTNVTLQLRGASKPGNFTFDEVLASEVVELKPVTGGQAEAIVARNVGSAGSRTKIDQEPATWQQFAVDFNTVIEQPRYVAVCLLANPDVSVAVSNKRVTGLLSLRHKANSAVSKGGANQPPPADIGVEAFEFWLPERRPQGKNLAIKLSPPLEVYAPANATRGYDRPVDGPNAWVADYADDSPWLELKWDRPQEIREVIVSLDTDYDHPMESVLMGHPERIMPYCVNNIRLCDDKGQVVAQAYNFYQSHWRINLEKPLRTSSLRIECEHPSKEVSASVFRVRCFA